MAGAEGDLGETPINSLRKWGITERDAITEMISKKIKMYQELMKAEKGLISKILYEENIRVLCRICEEIRGGSHETEWIMMGLAKEAKSNDQ